jgi:hypothetical protein
MLDLAKALATAIIAVVTIRLAVEVLFRVSGI